VTATDALVVCRLYAPWWVPAGNVRSCGGRDLWLEKWLRGWYLEGRGVRNRGSLVRAGNWPALAAGRAC